MRQVYILTSTNLAHNLNKNNIFCIYLTRLELDIQRYRDRLADAEYYKTRVAELREDNKALMETRDALEEQLQRARKRADQCLTLEAAMIKLKREANDIALASIFNYC